MLTVLAILLAAAPDAPDATKSENERVLVLDLGGDAISREEAGLVRDAMARELSTRIHAEVLTSADVRRLMDVSADRRTLDCDTDSCIAELGNAMGASRVVHGTVARLGKRLVLELSIIDPERVRTLGRASNRADDVESLYDKVPATVAALVSEGPPSPPPEEPSDGSFPFITVTGGTLGGVGLLTLGVAGGTLAYLISEIQKPNGSPANKQAFLDHNENLAIVTAVGGGVALLGGVLFVTGLIIE